MRPRLENAVVKLASSDAKRRSDTIARTKPPPAATPLTAAMTGLLTLQQEAEQRGQLLVVGAGRPCAPPDRPRSSG